MIIYDKDMILIVVRSLCSTEKIHGEWVGQCWCDGGKEERGDEEYDLRSLYIWWWWCWRWCWWRLSNCDDGGKSMPNRLCLDHFSITHFYRRSQVFWMVTMTMIHWSIRPWQCLSIPLSYLIRYGTYRCSSFDMLCTSSILSCPTQRFGRSTVQEHFTGELLNHYQLQDRFLLVRPGRARQVVYCGLGGVLFIEEE